VGQLDLRKPDHGASWRNSARGLSASAAMGSSFVVGSAASDAKTIAREVPWAPGVASAPRAVTPGPYRFFNADEATFIGAAVARLIPADELGPGAEEAGATTFIDRQLGGPYGSAERWHMQGPWSDGTESQGYQTRFTPAQFYRPAIKAINTYCRNTYEGQRFTELPANDQDHVLSGLENGEIKLEGVNAKAFFGIFLQNTIEGFFCDPIYGGNRDMVAWKLIGFPGARYDYRAYVGKHGQRIDLPPVGLKGRPDWTPRK
jgi:gluconate 2-dehydrogenase gamma chain